MRLPLIAATLTLACVFSAGVAAPGAGANQASSSSATPTASKPTTHKKKHHYTKRQPSQKAPTADRISEIQSALAHEGYYQGDPSGRMDAGTVAALEKFQSANGIDSTGKLDAPTLQKLGLGSDTAGISAPKAVVPPSCCSTTPTPAGPPSSQSAPASTSPVAQNSSAAAVTSDAKPAVH
jgi:hypothetical protein